ncbi:hypothetical protein [Agrococcus jejuensis]|uniref:hypothetical protein n=1 Tax=Agrococcus jejuensis TaxID=399736 RepID=UPI0011A6A48A|nr:hypothetical protein [Agrococcus jejuensis]
MTFTPFDVIGAIVQTATLIAVGVAAWQLLFHSRQMHRDFEALYVQRYWTLMDQRSDAFALDGVPTDRDRVIARGYLQLCEDEIDCRRIGRVTDSTWEYWRGAIIDQTSTPAYLAELDSVTETRYPLLRLALQQREDFDPLTSRTLASNWLWRKLHGL